MLNSCGTTLFRDMEGLPLILNLFCRNVPNSVSAALRYIFVRKNAVRKKIHRKAELTELLFRDISAE